MDNAEVINKAVTCIRNGRALVAALDQAPAFVRHTDHAQQARQTALESIELIGELVRRVRLEVRADIGGNANEHTE